MTNPNEDHRPPETSALSMIATLGGIAMLSGFLVVLVFQITKPMIEENQRKAIAKAISKVIPGAVAHQAFIVDDDGVAPSAADAKGTIIYAGYDAKGGLLGVAAKAGAQGYADMIYLLYGYDHTCECIRGIQVLKTAETPGLGDKIITDAAFVKNFDALDVRLNANGDALENAIVTVKHGAKRNEWEIDAISGATISSRAVGKALNNSARSLLPKLLPHIEALRHGAPDPGEIKSEKTQQGSAP